MAKKSKSEHYDVLKDALGTKTADAIVGVAREQAEDVFSATRAELQELATRVRTLHAEHGAAPEVKEAAQVVSEATKAHNAAETEPAEAAEDAERVEKARRVVDQAESELTQQVARHEQEINGEHGVCDRVAALEESHSSLQTAVANAVAMARSGQGGMLMRASRAALTVFAIVGVTYWLIWWLSPLDYQWETNLGLAFGAGAIAGWLALVWFEDEQSSAAANAEARTGGRDAGLDVVRPGQRAAAEALAETGRGRSGAGANASAH